MSRIRNDLKTIKNLGIDFVRLWVNWRDIELRLGAYTFTELKEIMDLADETGLSVVL